MKRLIVSLKTADDIFAGFKKALRKAKKSKAKNPHFEISFDNKKEFDKFVRNIDVLKYILVYKPRSVYDLAKITKIDVSNLNKVILFFEEVGALKVQITTESGRTVKKPVVEYDTIEFNLAA